MSAAPRNPATEPLAWLRYLNIPIAVAGLCFVDADTWPAFAVVLVVLILQWPFCIQLADEVEIYFPVTWTGAAAAYVLGPPILFVVWLAATAGFFLIGALDRAGILHARGLAIEGLKRFRGEPFAPGSEVDGLLRQFGHLSGHVVRLVVFAAARAFLPQVSFVVDVIVAEVAVKVWIRIAPIPGHTARYARERFRAALGRELVIATDLLHGVMVCFLLLSYRSGGLAGFTAASASTLVLHAILKALSDARLESERRRLDLLAMRDELDRRQRLALIGRTASTVFHQIARHHGAIGIFAHLLGRGPAPGATAEQWPQTVQEHARRIQASVEEAKRVIDELLRFGQDRALNLYPQSLAELIDECVRDCQPQAARRGVRVDVAPLPDTTVLLDKYKVKQALGNVLDNAIDATPTGERIEVAPAVDDARVCIAVRDYGAGVATTMQARLFTPFCTTKPQGIGLGLALARELLEAHGGSLEWHAVRPGALFVLTLPQRQA